ncbi:hypothetical protein CPB86DRAFT_625974 [Serendipita vermifera]|nr:hypothetical protein CPB86DRAFT_625974 [Serendipita vermifera]
MWSKTKTLDVISSCQNPIDTLIIRTSRHPACCYIGLNFRSLRELRLNAAIFDVQLLMDMALHSTREDFELGFVVKGIEWPTTIFTHPLLHQIRSFYLSFASSTAGDEEAVLDIGALDKITLPKVKKLRLSGLNTELVNIFETDALEHLSIDGLREANGLTPSSDALMVTAIPTQLVRLTIRNSMLNFSTTSAVHLPNLTELTLETVGLCAPLRRYIEAPQLKDLTLDYVVYISSNPIVPPLCDALFFQSIPQLEYLFISEVTGFDEPLADTLRYYSLLEMMIIEFCHVNKLIPALSGGLQDGSFLPKLVHTSIRNSWISENGTSYCDFRELIRTQRPGLHIEGNGFS